MADLMLPFAGTGSSDTVTFGGGPLFSITNTGVGGGAKFSATGTVAPTAGSGAGAAVTAAAVLGTGVSASSDKSQGVFAFSRESIGLEAVGETFGIMGLSGAIAIKGECNLVGTTPANIGIWGDCPNEGTGKGVLGTSTSGVGVQGKRSNTNAVGNLGCADPQFNQHTGVYGESDQQGVMGLTTVPQGTGVYGGGTTSAAGDQIGVRGETFTNVGAKGHSFGNGVGVFGISDHGNGIVGQAASDTDAGVNGTNSGKGFGVFGESVNGSGVEGHSTHGPGIVGFSNNGPAGVFNGDVKVTGDIQLTNGEDCAEEFDVSGALEIGPGTVMVINAHGGIQQSEHAYDRKVAGVVSGAGEFRPGIVLGKRETSERRLPIALLGKVYCKVDARPSPIEVGDLLTTSATPGHAMKADDPFRAVGSLIGKALHPLAEGQGLIPILVALQ